MGLLGIDIGTLAFFTFSFFAGGYITLQAVFWSKKETMRHRVIKGVVGIVYAVVTVLAFMQLEGEVQSPYVGTSQATAGEQSQSKTTY